ncbi:MAG TPA: hypothetical protein VHG08_13255 [Longimicrobium sp.]|nr:hypothetical protein [Longimicrobium sp.]
MRLYTLAAAAAALWLAAPAAAQQDPEALAEAALQQMVANQGTADDYTLVLRFGDTRVPVYVYRENGGWSMEVPPQPVLAEVMSAAVIWPVMLEAAGEKVGDEPDPALEEAVYEGVQTVDGRPAHVVSATFTGGEDLPDSMRLYLDAESRQLLRMVAAGRMAESDDELLREGAGVWMSLDLADYAATDGVVVPRRLRMRMRMELELNPKERQGLREDLDRARRELESESSEEAHEMRTVLEVYGRLLLEGEVDLPITVEEVHVNSGPPEWLKAATLDDPGA